MKPVFADTSFYVALLNSADDRHQEAKAWGESYFGAVVVTEYVLIELGNFFCRQDNRSLFVEFLPSLLADPDTIIVPAATDLFQRGFSLYANRPDKDWSLTDCVSFVVMKQRKLTEALTTDHHFRQAGFKVLMP